MTMEEDKVASIFDAPGDDEQEPENKAMGEGGADGE